MANGLKSNGRWVYYNRAIVFEGNPKENVIPTKQQSAELFKKYPKAFFIRYTEAFDGLSGGQWWYCVKDSEFKIEDLPSKKRNVVKNGQKNFKVCLIDAINHIDDFFEIINDANLGYDKPATVTQDDMVYKCTYLSKRDCAKVLGAFDIESNKLCGYLWIDDFGDYVTLVEQKVIRNFEKKQINAALVLALCEMYNKDFGQGVIISDGQRNIVHNTNFQNYLIKYFGFRKAYCKLQIEYKPIIKVIVRALYPFRRLVSFFADKTHNRALQNIKGVMNTEEILRWQKHEKI